MPIGTPHTHHYTCTTLALRAGKHVLCEKPFTSNAAELKSLVAVAKENNVFLMEVCTCVFMHDLNIAERLPELGDVDEVLADHSGYQVYR
jgi:predicted dehydrogenase